ncbi:hypothetical protein NQD34_002731 [Periophthalmus magnuspinnatus]|uniref:placenta-specific gene 8 protein-like n=1 Tax=Periophthalmus magnuspinnatus TaxID=409849 RepID=UPI00145B133C|nr:placenta-specific gene 8 protein-like [Periophthalmus magnuspinnatus]KAJ0032650.1 hypothetical protein NQD34_002731 [Periophthalmus magnuspinnatus]
MALAPRTYTPLLDMSTIPPLSSGDVHPQCITEEGLWSTALMDCFEDAATCCYGFWCCPCLSCTVSGRLQQPYCLPLCDLPCCLASTSCLVPLLVPPAGLALRLTMRNKYKIKGSVLDDMMVACCCSWCSWCQMHRELKRRMNVITVQNVVSVQPPSIVTPTTVNMATETGHGQRPAQVLN